MLSAYTPGFSQSAGGAKSKAQPWRAYLTKKRLKNIEDTCKKPFIGSGNIRTRFEVTAKK